MESEGRVNQRQKKGKPESQEVSKIQTLRVQAKGPGFHRIRHPSREGVCCLFSHSFLYLGAPEVTRDRGV